MDLKATSLKLIVCFLALEATATRKLVNSQRRSISGFRGELAGSQQGFVNSGAFASAIADFGSLAHSERNGSPRQGNYAEAPLNENIGFADFAVDSSAIGSQAFETGNGGYGGNQGGYSNQPEPGMPYQFQYSVNEYGNNFGHSQSSDGSKVTGRYFVQLPDGRMQTVQFKADALSGYTADVQYEGQAQYPSHSNAGGYGGVQEGLAGSSLSTTPRGAGNSIGGHGGAGPSASGYPAEDNFGLGNGIGGGSIGLLPLAIHGDDSFNRQPVRY